jgi:hypothetical protein
MRESAASAVGIATMPNTHVPRISFPNLRLCGPRLPLGLIWVLCQRFAGTDEAKDTQHAEDSKSFTTACGPLKRYLERGRRLGIGQG